MRRANASETGHWCVEVLRITAAKAISFLCCWARTHPDVPHQIEQKAADISRTPKGLGVGEGRSNRRS